MAQTTPHVEPPVSESRQRLLWLGLLSGPIIYSVYFLAGYLFVEISCRTGLLQSHLWGISMISVVVLVLTLLALTLTLFVGFLAYRRWRQMEERDVKSVEHGRLAEGPEQFMTFAGFVLNGLFAIIILLTGIPALLLWPCGWI